MQKSIQSQVSYQVLFDFEFVFFHLDEAKPKKEGLTLRISRFRLCLTVCFVFLKFMFLGLLLYGQKNVSQTVDY